jgi:octaprenyl-diphosphate synthase
MPIRVEGAVATLSRAAEARQADEQFQERAEAIGEILSEDLSHVEQALEEVTGGCLSPADAAARHLIAGGGKRIRPVALLLSSACFGPVPAAARELAVVAELVHSSTLLHDDVVDEGMVRRGACTSRRLWGNGVSVLAGDLLLVHSLSHTLEHFAPALPSLVETLGELVEGEVIQMRGRTELDVSEATYAQILRGKTASLFAWATRAGAMTAGADPEAQACLSRFGSHVGMAFQLVDDVLDYTGEATGKTLFADLCEGKLTLPLVLAIERRPELLHAVQRIHAGDAEPVATLCRAVIDSEACVQVRRRAQSHTDRAIEALGGVPAGPARDLLETVSRQLGERTS